MSLNGCLGKLLKGKRPVEVEPLAPTRYNNLNNTGSTIDRILLTQLLVSSSCVNGLPVSFKIQRSYLRMGSVTMVLYRRGLFFWRPLYLVKASFLCLILIVLLSDLFLLNFVTKPGYVLWSALGSKSRCWLNSSKLVHYIRENYCRTMLLRMTSSSKISCWPVFPGSYGHRITQLLRI